MKLKINKQSREAAVAFTTNVPEAVRGKVLELAGALMACSENVIDIPPFLDLTAPKNELRSNDNDSPPTIPRTKPTPIEDLISSGSGEVVPKADKEINKSAVLTSNTLDRRDPANTQFRDHWCWEVETNTPDPGQTYMLRKYDPVNVLQLPERARTLAEAIDAIRLCDRQCIKITNQTHCK